MILLSTGNPKTLKGMKDGYNTYILHLAPASLSGHNTCPKATAGCKAACLNTAGRGGMFKKGEYTNNIQKARIRKTVLLFDNQQVFMETLIKDINLAIKQSKRLGLTPVFRLNGTSDLSWEKIYIDSKNGMNIFQVFQDYQFYDYTKMLNRKVSHIKNYHLTFSAADGNDNDTLKAYQSGYNIAVVFNLKKTLDMPDYHIISGAGYSAVAPVYNGDESDLRFLDPRGHIVGLYAKGKAKNDNTGFVKQPIFPLQLAA